MDLSIKIDSTREEDLVLAQTLQLLAANARHETIPCTIGGIYFDLNLINFIKTRDSFDTCTYWFNNPAYNGDDRVFFEANFQSVLFIKPDPKVLAAEESVKKAEEALEAAKESLKKVKEK